MKITKRILSKIIKEEILREAEEQNMNTTDENIEEIIKEIKEEVHGIYSPGYVPGYNEAEFYKDDWTPNTPGNLYDLLLKLESSGRMEKVLKELDASLSDKFKNSWEPNLDTPDYNVKGLAGHFNFESGEGFAKDLMAKFQEVKKSSPN